METTGEQTQSWLTSVGDAYQWAVNRADIEIKTVWRGIARRRLESDLSDIVRVASGHKKDKVAKGSSQYQELWRIADEKVTAFCIFHNVPRESIDAQIPALTELEQLGTAPVVVPYQRFTFTAAGIVGSVLIVILIGIVCSFISHLFGVGTHVGDWISHLL